MILPETYSTCRFVFNVAGVSDQMGTTLGFRGAGPSTPEDDAQILYDEWTGVFISTPASCLVGWTFVGVVVTRTVGGEPYVTEVTDPIVGTGAADGLVVNTCMLIRKNTASGGRKNRGRMFVPPFNVAEEEVENSGQIAPAAVAAQTVGWNSFLSAIETGALFPFLYHSHVDDAPTPITSLTAQNLAATQRRRMR